MKIQKHNMLHPLETYSYHYKTQYARCPILFPFTNRPWFLIKLSNSDNMLDIYKEPVDICKNRGKMIRVVQVKYVCCPQFLLLLFLCFALLSFVFFCFVLPSFVKVGSSRWGFPIAVALGCYPPQRKKFACRAQL